MASNRECLSSQNDQNPVLLLVHGGPGMPDHFLTKRYPTGLEELFTVVWWEQRGIGLSYHGDIPAKTMTVNQFVSDTLALANYLRSRFGKEKIYLMGHSWGSFIGIQAAAQAPARCWKNPKGSKILREHVLARSTALADAM